MMNYADKFSRAMHILKYIVEDTGMECGISEQVEISLPRRSFDLIMLDLERSLSRTPAPYFSSRCPEFQFMGMKVKAKDEK